MRETQGILEQLMSTVSKLVDIPPEQIECHLSDPLNGSYFKMDAINMVYFVMEIIKSFGAQKVIPMLDRCMFWSLLDIAEYLESNKRLETTEI
jgi:hypothetical protein